MHNQEIRQAAKEANVPLWRIADVAYGITDSYFSRKLRHELPAEEKTRILEIIKELAKGA